jgi:hypothetical protein
MKPTKLLLWLILVSFPAASVWADLIPPGHKAVKHELVFAESEALNSCRLVAAPVRGFHGATEIRAGQRFRFSTKYGTRFYVIPDDVDLLPEFDRELYAQWPSAEPPVSEMKSNSLISPVTSAVTTLKLSEVSSEAPTIELVSHAEFDGAGQTATWRSALLRPLTLVPAGILLLLVTMILVRRSKPRQETPT